MTIFTKPFDDIDAADIQNLCMDSVYENQLLEFKRELQGERGRTDPWMTGGDVTPSARNGLFREIVAFANAQGGTLIVGIEQIEGEPPRAANIMPLPRIHDLASRMENAARSCIDPVLPGLHIRGIEMGTTGGEGVLILRVAPSPFGPHRVVSDGHAFIRRGASSVQMTMREIQDLTLDLARGADRLDRMFAERAADFSDWLRHSSGERGACRITAIPLGAFPGLPRFPTDRGAPFPMKQQYRATYGDGDEKWFPVPSLNSTRPIVRGIRSYEHDDNTRIDVLQSGLIDLWDRCAPVAKEGRPREKLHFNWSRLAGAYLAVTDVIDWVRATADVPDWEFAIAFALDGLIDYHVETAMLPAIKIVLDDLYVSLIHLPVKFPRVPYRNRADREILFNLFFNDLFDAAGERRNAHSVAWKILD